MARSSAGASGASDTESSYYSCSEDAHTFPNVLKQEPPWLSVARHCEGSTRRVSHSAQHELNWRETSSSPQNVYSVKKQLQCSTASDCAGPRIRSSHRTAFSKLVGTPSPNKNDHEKLLKADSGAKKLGKKLLSRAAAAAGACTHLRQGKNSATRDFLPKCQLEIALTACREATESRAYNTRTRVTPDTLHPPVSLSKEASPANATAATSHRHVSKPRRRAASRIKEKSTVGVSQSPVRATPSDTSHKHVDRIQSLTNRKRVTTAIRDARTPQVSSRPTRLAVASGRKEHKQRGSKQNASSSQSPASHSPTYVKATTLEKPGCTLSSSVKKATLRRKKKKKTLPSTQDLVTVARAKLPVKGNTRSWRMNQLIKAVNIQTVPPDLLQTTNKKTCANKVQPDDVKALCKRSEGLTQTPGSGVRGIQETPRNATSTEKRTSTAEEEGIERRSSVPSWVMTPRQMDMLLQLHTGLTPRPTSGSVMTTESPTTTTAVESTQLTYSCNNKPAFPILDPHDQGEAEDGDYSVGHSAPTAYYAADILGSVESDRSLQSQRLIERHRKKLESLARTHVTSATSNRRVGESSQKHNTSKPSHYPADRVARDEMKAVLEKKEQLIKRGMETELRTTLRWIATNAASEQERQQALAELSCLEDSEHSEEDTDVVCPSANAYDRPAAFCFTLSDHD